VNDTITTRDKAVIAIKNLTSILPKIGIMYKPNYQPNGITFIIATKNEERWIKPSIESIADVVNKIIVIDSKTNDEKRFGELPKLLIDNEKSFFLGKSDQ
jgi:hypothetical protein